MSELAVLNQNLPAHLRSLDGIDDTTKALMGGGGGTKRISIEGGVWRMMVNGKEVARNEERSMKVVIVNMAPAISRMYYPATYEEGKEAVPSCFSADGKVPDETAPDKQSPNCASCPQNVAGSGQGKSRACRFNRRYAVVLEGDMAGSVYRLQLPAKSLFGEGEGKHMPAEAYRNFLAGHGVPMSGVVTEAKFDTAQAVPVLKFKAVRPLTEKEWEISKQQGQSTDALQAIEPFKLNTKPTGPLPALYDERPMPAVDEVGAGIPEEELSKMADEVPEGRARHRTEAKNTAESEPAPVKRASKKTAEPPAPKSATDILNEWGSDDDDE